MSYGLYLLSSPVQATNVPDRNADVSMRPSNMDAARELIEQLEMVAPSAHGLAQQRNCVAAISNTAHRNATASPPVHNWRQHGAIRQRAMRWQTH